MVPSEVPTSLVLRPETSTIPNMSGPTYPVHPLLGISEADPLGLGIVWRNKLRAPKLLSLVGHHVSIPCVFPAAGYAKMVAEAALSLSASRVLRKFELEDFFVQNELTLATEEGDIQVMLELQSTGSHQRRGERTDFLNFRIRSISAGATTPQLNALGCIRLRSSAGNKVKYLDSATGHLVPPAILDSPVQTSATRDTAAVSNKSSAEPKYLKILPMSSGQSGFWFMLQLVGDPTFFNGTVSFLITHPNLDIELLARLVRDMGRRHEGLRTAFFADPKSHQPLQGILPESPLHLETKTMSSRDQVRTEIDAMNRHVYDISRGETVRLLLLTEGPGTTTRHHHLILGYHHINIDGMSIMAMTDDLRLTYGGHRLPPPFQHSEFTIRQGERLRTGQYASDIAFWRSEFPPNDHPEILPILPLSPGTTTLRSSRPSTRKSYRHVRAETRVSPALTARLRALREQGHIQSPFVFYTTILQILLGRLAGSQDICIGVASANRQNDPESAGNTVGIMLNLFALRLRGDLSRPFRELLRLTKAKTLAGLKHSAVPFDVVLEEVGAARHPSHSPLFQAFVNYIPVSESRVFGGGEGGGGEGGVMENEKYEIGETLYDVMLAVVDPPPPAGDAWVAIMLQRELYSQRDAQLLLGCFTNLMEAFTADVDLPGTAPQMFDGPAVERALELGRGPSLDMDFGSVLRVLLDGVSAERAGEVALRDTNGGGGLSHGDMMERSVRIAQALSEGGVAPKSRIGALQEPTLDWVCSMLGIWRFGGSYVPLEVTQGNGRLRSIAKDANLAAVLVHDATQTLSSQIGLPPATVIINLSAIAQTNGIHVTTTPNFYTSLPDDEAIVLYTSGSTGVPKGISLPHRMVTNTIVGFLHSFPAIRDTPQTVLQQIALSFDVSWWQTLVGIATGGCVVVAGKETRRDPFALTRLILSHGVTLTLAVPSEAASWLQHGDLAALRSLSPPSSRWAWHISAGEAISQSLIDQFRALRKPDLRFINAYGPAETIIPTAYELPFSHDPSSSSLSPVVSPQNAVPIGRVLANYAVAILDHDGHPLPPGVPGEIVISGAGVAAGYIGQPDLTAARFPRDLLQATPRHVAHGWTRAHRSGDRGYLREEDGVFVMLGRMGGDTQVKIRGQRFDLGEVEAGLVTVGNGGWVREAVCHVRRRGSGSDDEGGDEVLVAHVVLGEGFQRGGGGNGMGLDARLRDMVSGLPLPGYMRPSVVVPLPSMPLNHHGKVDRKLLAKMPLAGRGAAVVKEMQTTTGKTRLAPRPRSTTNNTQHQSLGRSSSTPTAQSSGRILEEIWREILCDLVTDSQKLDQNSDFFLVGGNSLLLIKVKSRIKERTGLDVPLVQLFENSTLGKMAAVIGENIDSGQPQQDEDAKQVQDTSSRSSSTPERMKHIWLSVLGDIALEQDIKPESDFFLVGGNSLLLISVQKEVNREFGVFLPLAQLFEASTLDKMSKLLDEALATTTTTQHAFSTENDRSQPDPSPSYWQDEIAFKGPIPPSLLGSPPTNNAPRHRTPPPGNITLVLTGATGFLGRHILQRLVDSPVVKSIHCIAVRDLYKCPKTLAPYSSPKVVVHPGDLRDPLLGLSPSSLPQIFSPSLAAIIHNGADVSFLRSYATIRAANVLSTKTLVRLALQHCTHPGTPLPAFHYISTAGVVQLLLPPPPPPSSSSTSLSTTITSITALYEEPLPLSFSPPPTTASSSHNNHHHPNSYLLTKWASEKYLENCHAATKLPVTIHRPSYITGPGAPQLDVMDNILAYAAKMHKVPKFSSSSSVDGKGFGSRWLQFVAVGEVAGDIVRDVLGGDGGSGGDGAETTSTGTEKGVQYRNHCGEEEEGNWVRLDQLGAYLEKGHGGRRFEQVGFEQWIDEAGRRGMPVQVSEYLRDLVGSSGGGNGGGGRSWTHPMVLKGPRGVSGPWRRGVRL